MNAGFFMDDKGLPYEQGKGSPFQHRAKRNGQSSAGINLLYDRRRHSLILDFLGQIFWDIIFHRIVKCLTFFNVYVDGL
jgi:hypothetical protein